MKGDMERTEIKSDWARSILLDMIKKDYENWKTEELPFDNENHIRTFIFTKKEIDYEET
jgi:hypothetical protein